jgi:hypothetical protein
MGGPANRPERREHRRTPRLLPPEGAQPPNEWARGVRLGDYRKPWAGRAFPQPWRPHIGGCPRVCKRRLTTDGDLRRPPRRRRRPWYLPLSVARPDQKALERLQGLPWLCRSRPHKRWCCPAWPVHRCRIRAALRSDRYPHQLRRVRLMFRTNPRHRTIIGRHPSGGGCSVLDDRAAQNGEMPVISERRLPATPFVENTTWSTMGVKTKGRRPS